MEIVEMLYNIEYEMNHILRHVLTVEAEVSFNGIFESKGLLADILCRCYTTSYDSYYSVYNNGLHSPGGRLNEINFNKEYIEIDLERITRDEDYIFQLCSLYSTEELEYHMRSTIYHRDFIVHGVSELYFGDIDLVEKVKKYKEMEHYKVWRRVRLS